MPRFAALALPSLLLAAIAAPALAEPAPASVRLVLNRADLDGDGIVTPVETAQRLAEGDAAQAPVAEPILTTSQSARSRARRAEPHDEGGFPGLSMKRRLVPPSEFEQALEHRFQEELRQRRKRR